MNVTTNSIGFLARRAAHRVETAERRRLERELAHFTTESEKAELSAILERNADQADAAVCGLISERVLATTEYDAA